MIDEINEAIINWAAKEIEFDAICSLVRLRKEALSWLHRNNENIGVYVEQFLLPTKVNLNLVDADSQPPESQIFVLFPDF